MIRNLTKLDTAGYHRAQAVVMKFRTPLDSDNLQLSEYVKVALQSGVNFKILNRYQMQSRYVLYWKIAYFSDLLSRDLQDLHARKQARRIALKVFETLLGLRSFNMSIMGPFKEAQNRRKFVKSFKAWQLVTN